MNKIRCYVTRKHNGLFLLTAFKPIITEVVGTKHDDAYMKYGDPAGYINMSKAFVLSMLSTYPKEYLDPKKIILYGSTQIENTTHYVRQDDNNLYDICCNSNIKDSCVNNVCSWFISKMFDIESLNMCETKTVFFSGEFL